MSISSQPRREDKSGYGTKTSGSPAVKGSTGAESQPGKAKERAVVGVYFPFISETFVRELGRAESTIRGTAYCLDHEEGCEVLLDKIRQGVTVRIILDHRMWATPSCRAQPRKVGALLAEGAKIKTLDLNKRGDYAILHAKTWCVDGLTYLGGSANFTNNACKSEESLLIIKDPEFLTEAMNWFDDLWENPECKEAPHEGGHVGRSK